MAAPYQPCPAASAALAGALQGGERVVGPGPGPGFPGPGFCRSGASAQPQTALCLGSPSTGQRPWASKWVDAEGECFKALSAA